MGTVKNRIQNFDDANLPRCSAANLGATEPLNRRLLLDGKLSPHLTLITHNTVKTDTVSQ